MVGSIGTFDPSDALPSWSRAGLFTAFAGENAGSECNCVVASTTTRIDETHLQIDFAEAVLDLPTLRWVGAYRAVPVEPNTANLPELVIKAVSLGTITPGVDYDSVTRVTLTTSEQGATDYTAIVFGLEPA